MTYEWAYFPTQDPQLLRTVIYQKYLRKDVHAYRHTAMDAGCLPPRLYNYYAVLARVLIYRLGCIFTCMQVFTQVTEYMHV